LPGGEAALLLDADTGTAGLIEPRIKEQLQPVKEVHILLSHYHLDRVSGLFYLPAVWPAKRPSFTHLVFLWLKATR